MRLVSWSFKQAEKQDIFIPPSPQSSRCKGGVRPAVLESYDIARAPDKAGIGRSRTGQVAMEKPRPLHDIKNVFASRLCNEPARWHGCGERNIPTPQRNIPVQINNHARRYLMQGIGWQGLGFNQNLLKINLQSESLGDKTDTAYEQQWETGIIRIMRRQISRRACLAS